MRPRCQKPAAVSNKQRLNRFRLGVAAFSVATLVAFGSVWAAHRGRYYEKPRTNDLSPEEYAEYIEERELMRAFGIRYKPEPCRFVLIDEGGEYEAGNLVLLCAPLFLPIAHSEQ